MRKFLVSIPASIGEAGYAVGELLKVQHPERHFNLCTGTDVLKKLAAVDDVDAFLQGQEHVLLTDVFGAPSPASFALVKSDISGPQGHPVTMVYRGEGNYVLSGSFYEDVVGPDDGERDGYNAIRLTDEEFADVLAQVKAL